jgi:Holliday junction resolvase RusA-like endonuclease
MKIVKFKIPGEPMSKQRHRSTKKGRMYTPEQTINYENLVKVTYTRVAGDIFWDCEPMKMIILAVFPIPKSFSKKKINECLSGKIAPSQKDCDNIAKIVCDGLNQVAYTDDKHVVELYVAKMYTSDPTKVGVHVTIESFDINNIKYI